MSLYALGGSWAVQCLDSDGYIKWGEYVHNIVVDEFLTATLNYSFLGVTQFSNWYILLIGSNDSPGALWTYATMGTDFTEFTAYDETARVVWNALTVTDKQLTNSSNPAVFTASTGVSSTIYGAALVNYNTKGDSAYASGLMVCATAFGTSRPFAEGETLKVTYTIGAQSA